MIGKIISIVCGLINLIKSVTLVFLICFGLLNKFIESKFCSFTFFHEEHGYIHLTSRLDAIDSKTIWEFKCVDNLNIDHKLQLIIYAWAYSQSMEKTFGKKDFILLNIKTGEMLKLKYDSNKITKIVNLLISDKYSTKKEIEDEDFIQLINNQIYNKN